MDVFSFPTIQGGIECKLSERWSVYGEYGYKYRDGLKISVDTPVFISQGRRPVELPTDPLRPTTRWRLPDESAVYRDGRRCSLLRASVGPDTGSAGCI